MILKLKLVFSSSAYGYSESYFQQVYMLTVNWFYFWALYLSYGKVTFFLRNFLYLFSYCVSTGSYTMILLLLCVIFWIGERQWNRWKQQLAERRLIRWMISRNFCRRKADRRAYRYITLQIQGHVQGHAHSQGRTPPSPGRDLGTLISWKLTLIY